MKPAKHPLDQFPIGIARGNYLADIEGEIVEGKITHAEFRDGGSLLALCDEHDTDFCRFTDGQAGWLFDPDTLTLIVELDDIGYLEIYNTQQ